MTDDGTARWAVLLDTVDEQVVGVREIVAYNLARGRRRRDLTQEQLGQRLTMLTGTKWSRATVSAAEKGWRGKSGRVRRFDVDELIAFSCALEMPLGWFFTAPAAVDSESAERPVTSVTINKSANPPYAVLTLDRLGEIAGVSDDAGGRWPLNLFYELPTASRNPSEILIRWPAPERVPGQAEASEE